MISYQSFDVRWVFIIFYYLHKSCASLSIYWGKRTEPSEKFMTFTLGLVTKIMLGWVGIFQSAEWEKWDCTRTGILVWSECINLQGETIG